MIVRLATPEDLEALFQLNELFKNKTSLKQMHRALLENNREIVCIAIVGGVAAGYCTGLLVRSICYAGTRGELETLFVREEFRRRGIAGELLQLLEEQFRQRGITHFHLTTGANNERAQALFRRMGYTDTGEILMDKTI